MRFEVLLMKRFFTFALLILVTGLSEAKQLYVDVASGNDDVTYANNSVATPWQSIGRAVWGNSTRSSPVTSQAAQAGDVVNVSAGIYTTTQMSGERWIPAYNPVNSGTSVNPILIQANGVVTLRSNSSNGGGPIIGAQGRSYIVWDGFYLDEPNLQTVSDTAPVVIWGSDNVTIQNVTINGKTVGWNDNHNGIRVEDSTNSLIRNNRIYGIRNGGNNGNGAAIMIYTSSNITFEHNEIYNSGVGIFIKGRNPGPFTVRYNSIYDIDFGGIIIGQVGTSEAQHGARIYQNIIKDTAECMTFVGYDNNSPANIDIVNNTIDNCSNGGLLLRPSTAGFLNIVIKNNIITNSTRGIQAEDISDLSALTFSNNLYSGNNTHSRLMYTNYTFSTWRSNLNKDTVGSIQTSPLYVDESTDDFRLSGSSPAVDSGVDVLNLLGAGVNGPINMGAYITGAETIGLLNQLSPTPRSPIMIE